MSDTAPASVPCVAVGELLADLDNGANLLLLDVRNADEVADWRIEARRPFESLEVPYFDFLEDPDASIARVPLARPVIVLCAQGGSSAMVVEMLQGAGIASKNVAGGMVAYGDYLQPVPVPVDVEDGYELWQVNRRGKGCLSYIVRAGDEAVVIDPARQATWYQTFVASRGARIVRILDTHIHADHVSGGPALGRLLSAPYFVNAGEGFELRHKVEPLADGQTFTLADPPRVTIEVRVLHTPGHTPGSTSFLVGGRQLLTGDTLFVSSVGRPDLGGHVAEWGAQLFETLHARLADLDDDVTVFPAHCAGVHEMNEAGVVAGRLGDLRRRVPEMQIATPDAFVDAVRSAVKEPPASYAQIIQVNLGGATAGDDRISEWELGKNQCAASATKAAAHLGGGL